jgi:lipoprotein NlpD
MKKIIKRICALSLSLVILSACAQTQVSVKPTTASESKQTNIKKPAKPLAANTNKKTEAKTAEVKKTATPKPAITNQDSYIVETGDTLYGISFRAGLNYLDVASWNNIGEPFTVKSGQRIHLRPPEGAALPTLMETVETKPAAIITQPEVVKPAIVKPAVVATVPVKPSSPTKPVDKPPIQTKPNDSKPLDTNPADTKPVDTRPTDTKPSAGMPNWRWPTDGNMIARYVQGDPTQQGVNIAGKSGQAITAAADGTVVYSGAGLVGYGELIIIKHSNEWLSAYAHNKKRLVAEGSKVKAGDQIAEMGRTGVIRDMLHFEIRRNGKPVDPLLFLPKQ